MDLSPIDLTAEQQAFAREVGDFMDRVVTEEVHAEERATGNGFNEAVHLALGERGWLYPAWPVEDGGAGLDPVSCRILQDEIDRRRIPMITHGTTRLAWTAVEQFGSPELRASLKGEVAAGRIRICLGYTDPEGGSDIASGLLKAEPQDDGWVLNGAKMFTTGAQNCQYSFLLTRTDPSRPKHRGLTMFLVPLDQPGIEIQAIRTFGGERTNAVYYTDARVADANRLGPVNEGWATLHGPLDIEHGNGAEDGLTPISMGYDYARELEHAVAAVAAWAAAGAHQADGSPVSADAAFLDRFGEQIVECEAALVTPGLMGRNKGALALITGAAALIDIVGAMAVLPFGADGAIGGGALDYAHRFAQGTATYGGTTEVFRNMIAEQVLGLPRAVFPGSKALVR